MFNKLKDKQYIITLFAAVLLIAICARLVKLQLVMGETYKTQSENRLMSSVTIAAPRGLILDRYGRELVTNSQGYSVQIQRRDITNGELNDVILSLTTLFNANGEEYTDTLPITDKNFDFKYTDYDKETRKQKIAEFKKSVNADEKSSAYDIIEMLAEKYDIDKRYTDEQLRKIVGVRYEMELKGFSVTSPYTMANDISLETVTQIKENTDIYKNVSVNTTPVRKYPYGSLASHILGRVGGIYREEYEKLKDKNYGMNDVIGKDGIEKCLEEYLKGTDGKSSFVQSVKENSKTEKNDIPARQGNNVVLTIDAKLQQTAEEALKDRIAAIKLKGQKSKKHTGLDAGGGAVVVLDIQSGEVLAMASYPTFNISDFDKDYDKLRADKLNPMFNRAISGVYAPGSVFKMLTAIAGLETDAITTSEVIVDKGQYEYYGQKFNCWIYTDQHITHGPMTVSTALQNSCNYYFYEVGRRIGYKVMYDYGTKFGLGQLTGIELDGESKGVLANEDYKKANFNEIWYPGDNLQMAIGQSYNLFTPIQIANYIATIANGGSRYKVHLTKSVRNAYTNESVMEYKPQVLNNIEMKQSTINAVTYGMRLVSGEEGTAAIFADFPINVCSKTGSAQVAKGSANGVFASYAPYENPQIAVVAVVENAGSGSALAPIAKTIYEQYFKLNGEQNEIKQSDFSINRLVQ